nr:tyrosine-type recombinase/integrase [Pelistega ratti]
MIFPRQGELRFCKWEYIDWEQKTLTIPSHLMKGTKLLKQTGALTHTIALSTQAIRLLEQLQALTGHIPSGYLLPSTKGEGKVMSDGTLNKALRQIIPSDKQDIHGFRGLASTWLNEQHPEYSAVIEKMLSHKG